MIDIESITNQIINADCLEFMKKIPNNSIDCIICDPPYGTVKDLKTDGWKKVDNSWDKKIDTSIMFSLCENLLRENGILILFSQEPYTSELRSYNADNIEFSYPMIWLKNHFCNYLSCKKTPVSYFEDISVFYKKYDSDCSNELRIYFERVLSYINLTKTEIMKRLGHQKADHCFRTETMQFELCREEVYNELIEVFNIDKMKGFLPYKILQQKDNIKIFNLPENVKVKSNILKYDKEITRFHPTQKPVALLEDLIKTYSNENDLILDFCSGSGSLAVACYNLKRRFICIEKDYDYWKASVERLRDAQAQLKLF